MIINGGEFITLTKIYSDFCTTPFYGMENNIMHHFYNVIQPFELHQCF
jgi:hypothetical protein